MSDQTTTAKRQRDVFATGDESCAENEGSATKKQKLVDWPLSNELPEFLPQPTKSFDFVRPRTSRFIEGSLSGNSTRQSFANKKSSGRDTVENDWGVVRVSCSQRTDNVNDQSEKLNGFHRFSKAFMTVLNPRSYFKDSTITEQKQPAPHAGPKSQEKASQIGIVDAYAALKASPLYRPIVSEKRPSQISNDRANANQGPVQNTSSVTQQPVKMTIKRKSDEVPILLRKKGKQHKNENGIAKSRRRSPTSRRSSSGNATSAIHLPSIDSVLINNALLADSSKVQPRISSKVRNLSQKVSDLEGQLLRARRELQSSIKDLPSVPSLPEIYKSAEGKSLSSVVHAKPIEVLGIASSTAAIPSRLHNNSIEKRPLVGIRKSSTVGEKRMKAGSRPMAELSRRSQGTSRRVNDRVDSILTHPSLISKQRPTLKFPSAGPAEIEQENYSWDEDIF